MQRLLQVAARIVFQTQSVCTFAHYQGVILMLYEFPESWTVGSTSLIDAAAQGYFFRQSVASLREISEEMSWNHTIFHNHALLQTQPLATDFMRIPLTELHLRLICYWCRPVDNTRQPSRRIQGKSKRRPSSDRNPSAISAASYPDICFEVLHSAFL